MNGTSPRRIWLCADDYGMMYEVLSRRYRKREGLPDLIVVDGGKGQLGVALSVLKDLGIGGVDAIGLAKERPDELPRALGAAKGRASGGTGFDKGRDRVYLPGRKDPLFLQRHQVQNEIPDRHAAARLVPA